MIAFDTNVLSYCCDSRDAHRQQIALDLVTTAAGGVLLWQVALYSEDLPGRATVEGLRIVNPFA